MSGYSIADTEVASEQRPDVIACLIVVRGREQSLVLCTVGMAQRREGARESYFPSLPILSRSLRFGRMDVPKRFNISPNLHLLERSTNEKSSIMMLSIARMRLAIS